MSAELPKSIGNYTVIARLDQSGAAPVFKVRDDGGRTLAVKLYPAGENEDLRRFRRDALLKAVGLRHPGIIGYEEIGEHEGRVFAAMELVPGATHLKQPRPLHGTLRTVRQIAEGLGHLHRKGVVHGCLNPSRVLISAAGHAVKITEPGMCTATRPAAMDATATMNVAQMVRYIAPEARRANAVDPDPRADVYSLGVLFYQSLTGKVPLGRFKLPSQESDEVPAELDEVVLRCLRQDPAARYATTGEIVDAIDRVAARLPGGRGHHLETFTSAAMEVLSGGAQARSGWRRVSLAALGAIALIVAVFGARACI